VEIPNWVKWLALAGLIAWLITDPKGLGQFIGDLISGVVTTIKEAA
jgi:hypothetical protein